MPYKNNKDQKLHYQNNNVGLGMLGDNQQGLEKALQYVRI